jgi:hypothetical protein
VIDVGSATLIAHELGTTRVAILLNDGKSYDVDVITDARRWSRSSKRRTASRPSPTFVPIVCGPGSSDSASSSVVASH